MKIPFLYITVFLAGFAIMALDLLGMPPGENPATDKNDAAFDLPINDMEDVRRAQGATGTNKEAIEEFDDFVVHINFPKINIVYPNITERGRSNYFEYGMQ